MNTTAILSKNLRKIFLRYDSAKAKKSANQNISEGSFDYVKSPSSEFFTVGFGKESILPRDLSEKKYYIAGYNENNPAKGYFDEPHAHALWIDDNSRHGGVLFISLDNVGMLNQDVNKLRESLSDFCKRTSCRSVNVLSTHNHAGIDTMGIWGQLPKTGRDQSYIDFVFDAVRTSAETAYAQRKEGNLFYGTIEVPDMQEDIRTPYVFSRTLTRFRFVPNDGARETYIINFASHSESLQGNNPMVSADFPGYMREEIRKQTGAETFYCVGAIGGMISMLIDGEDEIRREGKNFLESTKNIGKKLASYAISINNEKKLSPTISFIRREFMLECDNTVLTIAGKVGIIKIDKYYSKDTSLGLMIKSELSYFEIGGIQILLLPCEIFPELVFGGYLSRETSATGLGEEANPIPLTKTAGADELLVFGLANDELGYVLPPNDFLLHSDSPYFEKAVDRLGRRHYEETNSVGPKTAPTIAKVFEKIMADVKEAKS